MTWKTFHGRVEEGHRVASGTAAEQIYPAGTIEMQIPHFRERGLDLSAFHPATLNISIAPFTFRIAKPGWNLRQVSWTHLHPPEDFLFSRCRLQFGGRYYDGIIYMPDPATKVRHFQNPSIVEVITERIPGVEYGSEVELDLNLDEVEIGGDK